MASLENDSSKNIAGNAVAAIYLDNVGQVLAWEVLDALPSRSGVKDRLKSPLSTTPTTYIECEIKTWQVDATLPFFKAITYKVCYDTNGNPYKW